MPTVLPDSERVNGISPQPVAGPIKLGVPQRTGGTSSGVRATVVSATSSFSDVRRIG